MDGRHLLPPVKEIWKRRFRSLVNPFVRFWRWLPRRIAFGLASAVALLAILFVIADRTVPQRMAYIVGDIGHHLVAASVTWIGTYPFVLPFWIRDTGSRPLLAYAANRHSARAQVDAAEHWMAFDDDSGDIWKSLVWLYGAYTQGYLPALFELREEYHAPNMKVPWRAQGIEAFGWGRTVRTSGGTDPTAIEARAINEAIEDRLNHGALAIAAYAIHRPGVYGWIGVNHQNLAPGELEEMRRRAQRWFDFEKTVEPVPGINCDDFQSVFDIVIAGRLHAMRTCIDRKYAAPMPYAMWRRFLACADAHVQRMRKTFQGLSDIEIVVACEREVAR